MQIGIVGLGRMGANIGRRLMKKGHQVVAFDREPKAVAALSGATGASSLKDLVGKLLDRAPESDKEILVLKELQDYSVEEIAGILELKPTTVKVRLHRARKRMLEDLRLWRKDKKSHAL